jgi:hypothetical protein
MYTFFYVLLAIFVTTKVSRIYYAYKFKRDVKFIQAIVENMPYAVQEKKIKKVKEVQIVD